MELLLNLFWLLLAVPAVWVWHQARHERSSRGSQSHRSLLILGCLLIVLFPVVSATDDMQAMRPEIEESATRDALRNPGNDKLASLLGSSCTTFAVVSDRFLVSPDHAVRGSAIPIPVLPLFANLVRTRAGRAPPSSSLA